MPAALLREAMKDTGKKARYTDTAGHYPTFKPTGQKNGTENMREPKLRGAIAGLKNAYKK